MNWDNPLVYIIPGLAALSGIIYLSRWMGKMDSFKDTIEPIMAEIRDDVKKIFERLNPISVSSASPLRLTDLGRKITTTLDGSGWAKRTAPQFSDQLRGQTPYQIQEFCFDLVRKGDYITSDMVKDMQNCAYENGMDVSGVEDVLAIELRDALLTIFGLEPPETQ